MAVTVLPTDPTAALPIPEREVDNSSKKRAAVKLLDRLDALEDEGKAGRSKYRSAKESQQSVDLYRGEQGPASGAEPHFKANFIEAFIDRQVALLTDNRPIIMVEPRKVGLAGLARVLDACADTVWTESAMQRQAWKLGLLAAIEGSAGLYTGYDAEADETYIEVVSRDQCWMDPAIREAALIGTHAEYFGIERIQTTAEIMARYLISVDADVSVLEDEEDKRAKTLLGPIETVIRRLGGRRDQTPTESMAMPRARTKEIFVKDRTRDPSGLRLFPTYRRILRTADAILWDGPLPMWDGVIPVDWYDWAVDPKHPWGMDEPQGLKHMQGAYNELLDGCVENHVLTSFIQFVADFDAVDEKTWQLFNKIKRSIVIRKKNRNATTAVIPPIPFGADTISLARFIFTAMQLKTGVTDVTLGEHPGSLQSGAAIAGLVEGASLMSRSRQSRLEDLYTRVGQKLIARVLQHFTGDRILGLLGPTPDAVDAVLKRSEFFVKEDGTRTTDAERREAFRYLRFGVVPGSSQAGARTARAKMMIELNKGRSAARIDVLRAAGIPDPEEMLKRADEEFAKMHPSPPPAQVPPGTPEKHSISWESAAPAPRP